MVAQLNHRLTFFKEFDAASVILPVINETYSLLHTIDTLESDCSEHVKEYIIVVCQRTTQESLSICEQLKKGDPSRYILHFQYLPFLGGAIREAFELARGTHVIMMASDLETDPKDVKRLIALSRERPDIIVTASRWMRAGDFVGYNRFKLILNYVFQKFFAMIFCVRLTDMTYGFRIFPTDLVKSINWEELKHPFLFETLIKPLRLGIPIYEIPSRWSARSEGESQNTFMRNFAHRSKCCDVRFLTKFQ